MNLTFASWDVLNLLATSVSGIPLCHSVPPPNQAGCVFGLLGFLEESRQPL
jgi:hypothetical protein